MQRKNWWMPMVATVAMFSLIDVSFGDDDENPSKVKSKDNQSKNASSDDTGPGRSDTDRMIASGLGCLDAAEIELARFAAGKAQRRCREYVLTAGRRQTSGDAWPNAKIRTRRRQ